MTGGGCDGVADSGSQGAVDLGDFIVKGEEERVVVDGGEQDAGVLVGAVDEGGEVGGFSSWESITVGGDVLFVGFGVNGEAGSFV